MEKYVINSQDRYQPLVMITMRFAPVENLLIGPTFTWIETEKKKKNLGFRLSKVIKSSTMII